MFPIVNSGFVASLEIVEMYKINLIKKKKKKSPAGKEILGHAFKSCLTKKKFLLENRNNFSVQFSMSLVLLGTICASLGQMTQGLKRVCF